MVSESRLLRLAFLLGASYAWSPASNAALGSKRRYSLVVPSSATTFRKAHHDEKIELDSFYPGNMFQHDKSSSSSMDPFKAIMGISTLSTFSIPMSASAASSNSDVIPTALAAYVHYLSLIGIVAALMVERLTVKPNMTVEEEKRLGAADIMLGVSGTALLISGYLRATQYGKGWDFYSHEPLFWLKMAGLGVFGGLSLFPTITIVKRIVAIQTKQELAPMSDKLAKRLTSILNAELSAIVFIPLTATLMSRGVGYIEGFPTQIVGPALFAVITGGAVYKYVKDALNWSES